MFGDELIEMIYLNVLLLNLVYKTLFKMAWHLWLFKIIFWFCFRLWYMIKITVCNCVFERDQELQLERMCLCLLQS